MNWAMLPKTIKIEIIESIKIIVLKLPLKSLICAAISSIESPINYGVITLDAT